MITINVLLFGHYKDAFSSGSTRLELPVGATAADAARALAMQDARLSDLLTRTRIAVRAEFAAADAVLQDGDEVAFLPPMSGG